MRFYGEDHFSIKNIDLRYFSRISFFEIKIQMNNKEKIIINILNSS